MRKRKCSYYLFILSMILLSVGFAGCSSAKTEKMSGIVVSVEDNSFIMVTNDVENTELIAVTVDGSTSGFDAIECGNIVEVTYDGYLMATSPAQTNPVTSISIIDTAAEDTFANAKKKYEDIMRTFK